MRTNDSWCRCSRQSVHVMGFAGCIPVTAFQHTQSAGWLISRWLFTTGRGLYVFVLPDPAAGKWGVEGEIKAVQPGKNCLLLYAEYPKV